MLIQYNPLLSLAWEVKNRINFLGNEITVSEQSLCYAILNNIEKTLSKDQTITTLNELWQQYKYTIYMQFQEQNEYVTIAYMINNKIESQVVKAKSSNTILDRALYMVLFKLLNLNSINNTAVLFILNVPESQIEQTISQQKSSILHDLDDNNIVVHLVNTSGATVPNMNTLKSILQQPR